jgi:hypothetical protein
VKVTVELSKDAVKKLEDIQERFGFRSLDDAASYVLNRYIKSLCRLRKQYTD